MLPGIALDEDDEIIGYQFVNFGKMTGLHQEWRRSDTLLIEKAKGQYGRVADAVKFVDPRKEYRTQEETTHGII